MSKIYKYELVHTSYDDYSRYIIWHENKYTQKEFNKIILQAFQQYTDKEANTKKQYNQCTQSKQITSNLNKIVEILLKDYGFFTKNDITGRFVVGNKAGEDEKYIRKHLKQPQIPCRNCYAKDPHYPKTVRERALNKECTQKYPETWMKTYEELRKN